MFTIKRFSEQFLLLFRQNKNRHLLILGIFVVYQLFGFVNYFTNPNHSDVESFYKTAIFFSIILCIVACQDVFNYLRSTPSGIQYLMLPATIVEKYAAAWLYSSLFSFLVVQGTFYVVQFVSIGLGNLLTGMDSAYGMPYGFNLWDVFQAFMLTHSVFFFGSILFRKNPIIKTLVSYMGIAFVATLAFAWYAKHFLFNTELLQTSTFSITVGDSFGGNLNGLQEFFTMLGMNIEWILGVIAVLLWSGSYLLLNKKQI